MKKLRKIGNVLVMAMAIAAVFTSCKKTLPTAAFTYAPETVVQFDTVRFTNTSTDATSYLWDFGNGGLTTTEVDPNIIFESTGDVVVKLTATNDDGSNTTEQTITVYARATAAFTYTPETVVQNDTVRFTNTSTDANSYLWDFSDGGTSTETDPIHQFTATGDFVVKLTATNDNSSNTTEQTITVNAP